MEHYLHGYEHDEQIRLHRQNAVLAPLIYHRIKLLSASNLLEVGCGTGAQILHLLKEYPNIHITGIDTSKEQLETCQEILYKNHISPQRYHLQWVNGKHFPYPDQSFDVVLFVWVLEHVKDPTILVQEAFRVLKPGGSLYITEVYNDSFRCHPPEPDIMWFWTEMERFQSSIGGQGNVGIQLANIVEQIPYKSLSTWAVPVFYDQSQPEAKRTMWQYWMELMESASSQMIKHQVISKQQWEKVESALKRQKECKTSVFFYNWIQAHITR